MAQSSSIIFNAARSRSGSFSRSLSPCVRGSDTSRSPVGGRSPHMATLASSNGRSPQWATMASSGGLLRSSALAGSGDGLLRSPSCDQPLQLSTLAADAARRSRPTSRTPLTTGRVQRWMSPVPNEGASRAGSAMASCTMQKWAIDTTGNLCSEAFSTEACPKTKDNIDVAINEEFMAGNNLTERDVMMLHFYSKFNPSPVSLSKFLNHGKGSGKLEDSFLFLRREIPVRLANCLSELLLLPKDLKDNANCRIIQSQFATSFKEIIQFENLPNESETHDAFNETLSEIRKRHVETVTHMADAVLSMNLDTSDPNDGVNRSIQYFLDRLYMSWISIKMLISHHKLIYCPDESKSTPVGMVGSIDPVCDVAKVAEAAFENAQFLCDQLYMDAPKLNLRIHDATDPNAKSIKFTYIPSHLYHMFFEIFKNSMRATMEFHEGEDMVPDINVQVVKSTSDISIRISDNGGGMSRISADKIFLYLYTSASRVKLSEGDMGGTTSATTPMHGLGYGLPLSKLYARYLGGDIKVSSCDGYGTDAFIYLKSLRSEAYETLPIYNVSSVNKLKNTSTQVKDWTSDQ